MDNKQNLPLRLGVGIILLNKENKVFVGRRLDNPLKFWQMPQGGIDNGESFFQAAKRELEEETAITKVKLIKELDDWLIYNLPDDLLGKIWQGKYRGQKQKWFVMKFEGNEKKDINLNISKAEFSDWKWVNLNELENLIVPFKKEMYKKILKEFEYKIKELN